MMSAVLVHLVSSVAATDPVATNPAHAHAAAGALLRMLRQGDVREAARCAIKASEGDERAARSVEICALSGMLGVAAAPRVPSQALGTQATCMLKCLGICDFLAMHDMHSNSRNDTK